MITWNKNRIIDAKIRKQLRDEQISTKSFEQFCKENDLEVNKEQHKPNEKGSRK